MSIINKESAFAVAALAILIFVLINKEQKLPESQSNKTIKYWPFVEFMWNPNDNLRTVKRVFDRLGHERVNGSESDDWDVFWSIEYPFYMFAEQMKSLKPHQRVNHFPGINYLTHKAFMATNNLFPFIPAAFEFPSMVQEFNDYLALNPEKKFVVKLNSNRGVKIVSVDEINFKEYNHKMYQEFVENPLLIDGHAFDLGVYVLITSLKPLRIYRYLGNIIEFNLHKNS